MLIPALETQASTSSGRSRSADMSPGYKPPSVQSDIGFADGEAAVDSSRKSLNVDEDHVELDNHNAYALRAPQHREDADRRSARANQYPRVSELAGLEGSRPRTRSVGTRRADLGATTGTPRSKSTTAPRRDTIIDAGGTQVAAASPLTSSGKETRKEAMPTGVPDAGDDTGTRPRSPSAVSTVTNLTSLTTQTDGSGSSSGSGSTITQGSFTLKESVASPSHATGGTPAMPWERPRKPDALCFLEPDSPAVTQESIRRSVSESAGWQPSNWSIAGLKHHLPSARSSSSTVSSGSTSSLRSSASSVRTTATHGTDPGPSTDRSVIGDTKPPGSSLSLPTGDRLAIYPGAAYPRQQRAWSNHYGSPRLPHSPPSGVPHVANSPLPNPRVPSQGHHKNLPRVEEQPFSGYELLAQQLSAGSSQGHGGHAHGQDGEGSPRIKPIYRRFESLNHRLLLHMQDELGELEEQLQYLDMEDARLRGVVVPASRRKEALVGGELQFHKMDILGKIGFKLGQYNHVLSSFTETQKLPGPSMSDVDNYRSYLAINKPIDETETRFLDSTDDLVSLSPTEPPSATFSAQATPGTSGFSVVPASNTHGVPTQARSTAVGAAGEMIMMMTPSTTPPSSPARPRAEKARPVPLSPLPVVHLAAAAGASAVLVPILLFAVIPGFLGRMAVVLLVGLALLCASLQAGGLGVVSGYECYDSSGTTARHLLLCAGVYAGVMAIIAGLCL